MLFPTISRFSHKADALFFRFRPPRVKKSESKPRKAEKNRLKNRKKSPFRLFFHVPSPTIFHGFSPQCFPHPCGKSGAKPIVLSLLSCLFALFSSESCGKACGNCGKLRSLSTTVPSCPLIFHTQPTPKKAIRRPFSTSADGFLFSKQNLAKFG